MEVVFGVQSTDRSLKVDLAEEDAQTLRRRIEEIFADGAAGQILWITDTGGRVLGIPVDKLAYIELGADKVRQVGFSANR